MNKKLFATIIFIFIFFSNTVFATDKRVELLELITYAEARLAETVVAETRAEAVAAAEVAGLTGGEWYWIGNESYNFFKSVVEAAKKTVESQPVYSLANDNNLQNTINGGILGSRGAAMLTPINQTINVTNRTHNWEGLDINIAALNITQGERFTLKISGSAIAPVPQGARVELMLNGSNWAWIDVFDNVSADDPNFSMELTFSLDSEYEGIPVSDFRAFTVQTNPQGESMGFNINKIEITPFKPVIPTLPADRLPSLSVVFADYFLIGNIWCGFGAVNRMIDQPGMEEHFLHQYNSITAGNHHKPASILPVQRNFNPEEWSWTYADKIVEWANENDFYMVGHTLIWHEQSRDWLTNTATGALPREEAINNMEFYINTVAERYSGKMDAWDVVNEVIDFTNLNEWNANPDWRQHIRRGSDILWYHAFANGDGCGSDYVYYAYRFARLADPNAQLIYNDFSEYAPGRRDAIAQMVEQINERWRNDPLYDNRLLIEIIGLQGHYQMGMNINNLRTALELYADTGARIHISELDVRINDFDTARNNPVLRLNTTQLEQQAALYKNLFSLFMEFSDVIDRVSFWGTDDDNSWLAGGAPLLYTLENGNFMPKPAFWAILELMNITEE